jgi:hypothetical protein
MEKTEENCEFYKKNIACHYFNNVNKLAKMGEEIPSNHWVLSIDLQ